MKTNKFNPVKLSVFFIIALSIICLFIVSSIASSEKTPPLLFGIGLHIEPLGSVPSELVGNKGEQKPGKRGDYNNREFFNRHVADIKSLASIVEKHGGKLTVQAQSPFTQVTLKYNEKILSDMEKKGHEIGLHFHEDAHLGRNSSSLPVKTWAAVMSEEISYIKQNGIKKVRYWSGGNLYNGVLEAASMAGLDIMSDWKNPRTQTTDSSLTGLNPWRPSAGPSADNVTGFANHAPSGKIIFLPEGNYTRTDFASMRRSENTGGDFAYFEYLKSELNHSLEAVKPDRVNVFHFTVHPGEFRGKRGEEPFSVIDRYLTEVIDPLVKSGKVRWSTFSDMADEFKAWEKSHQNMDPRACKSTSTLQSGMCTNNTGASEKNLQFGTSENTNSKGYITFVVNVHDFIHTDESAKTILKLISIFKKYKVRGDFYFTAPVTETYAKKHPEVIKNIKESHMTVSYHIRPPHPVYPGFAGKLKGLPQEKLIKILKDYETYRLDLKTGDLIKEERGGYSYVASAFGSRPVAIGVPAEDKNIKKAAMKVYAEMGAKMIVLYHESGTDPKNPFEETEGLLIRPSDFSITRWKVGDMAKENFWWNMLSSRYAAEFNPEEYLKKQISLWNNDRKPFITSLIHENNFYRRGPEAWTSVYYADKDKREPLSPPYNLNATDPSRERPDEEQEAIWKAYESMVAWGSKNLTVVTSEDIVSYLRMNP